MTITPFLTLKLRGKKDALRARQQARRVAHLLCYHPHEQTCIAAGTFVVACQALELYGKAMLCYQIENRQLTIFAQEIKAESTEPATACANRITRLFREPELKPLYRLTKPLPVEQNNVEELDLAWLVTKIAETAVSGIFDEIVKQNQETLALLHELRLFQVNLTQKEEKPQSPHAA